MINIKTYYLIILFMLGAAPLLSQKDQEAEPYLDKISRSLSSENATHIKFDYIREDLQAETKNEGSGQLLLFEDKYRIDLGEAIIFFDGTKQYSLQLEIEEVYVSTPDPENKEFMFTDPIKLLRDYKETFKYRLMGESMLLGLKVNEVQLYPEELGGPYALLKLFFDLQNDNLKGIVIRHKKGILYTMIITELENNENPGESYFKFNQEDFPEVEVIELLN